MPASADDISRPLRAAPPWQPSNGWAPFTPGAASNRQVLRHAAFRRNLDVQVRSKSFCVISDGQREVGFWNHNPDTTSRVARRVSNTRVVLLELLARQGLRAPRGALFERDDPDEAWAHARGLGVPVVVRSNRGGKGQGVTLGVTERARFDAAWSDALGVHKRDGVVIEPLLEGNGYRLFVVGDRVAAVVQRLPHGEMLDVTEALHPQFELIAVRAMGVLDGVAHAGVDLVAQDLSSSPSDQSWGVCNLSTAPDIAMHHFPVRGTPRDAAGALLEHLFPGAEAPAYGERRTQRVVVAGKVTTTKFHRWAQRLASLRALQGWVRTVGPDRGELVLHGAPRAVDHMVQACRDHKRAKVVDVHAWEGEVPGSFEIRALLQDGS